MALGLAIGKFSPGRTGFATGMAFIGLGAVFLFYSGRRYFSVLEALERGQFRINKRGIKVVMALVGLIALGCALVVLVEATHLSGYAAGYGAAPALGPATPLAPAPTPIVCALRRGWRHERHGEHRPRRRHLGG